MREYSAMIAIEPVPKLRARTFTRNGHVGSYTPSKTRSAEKAIREAIEFTEPTLFTKELPLVVRISFFLTKPSSVRREKPTVRPDLDNYTKLVLDACNKLLWEDDGQIVELHVSKHYVSALGYPHIHVRVQVDTR